MEGNSLEGLRDSYTDFLREEVSLYEIINTYFVL